MNKNDSGQPGILTRPRIEPASTVLVADAPCTDRLMNFIFVLQFI